MAQSIVDCFTAHYKRMELNSNGESANGVSILFNFCRILNTKAWPNLTEVSSLSIFLIKIFLLFIYGSETFFQSLFVILLVLVQQPFYLFYIVLLLSKTNIKYVFDDVDDNRQNFFLTATAASIFLITK